MGQVGVITPVIEGRADALTALLRDLPRDRPPTQDGPVATDTSPFTGVLPSTHFARFVVIELDHDTPHLFFTSVFDGDTREYLSALAQTPQALEIFSHCQIANGDDVLTTPVLARYLCAERNWRPSQYVVNALSDGVTVGAVNRALALRAQLGPLVARSASMDPVALAHDFRQLEAIQALMAR
jgi:hypothetical protein